MNKNKVETSNTENKLIYGLKEGPRRETVLC